MGWICGCNRFGVYVREVEEPAGKPPKGRVTMLATEVERCSSGGWTGHFVREIYATKAEAEKVALVVEEAYREWRKRDDEIKATRAAARKATGNANCVHLEAQREVYRTQEDYLAAREEGLALCEIRKSGSKILTADKTKVTCWKCVKLLQSAYFLNGVDGSVARDG